MYLWDYLKTSDRPIVLYGKGNGGDKVFDCCERFGVKISAVFSSDDRQSGGTFHGLPVGSLASVCEEFENPIILLGFGTERQELVEYIASLDKKYELYAPDLPVSGGEIITDEFVELNREKIDEARELLGDDQSRKVFDNLLGYKHSGKISYLLDCQSDPCEKEQLLTISGLESFLDLGAFTGDTIQEFLDWSKGEYKEIIALEPSLKNYEKLKENTAGLHDVHLYNLASWNKKESLTFTGKAGRNVGVVTDVIGRKPQLNQVEATSVDELNLAPSLVKMDVEGAERESLAGMRDTINRYHPSLQISVYHRTDDFYEIPLLLNNICQGYTFYLRHHTSLPAWELQLYCKWKK